MFIPKIYYILKTFDNIIILKNESNIVPQKHISFLKSRCFKKMIMCDVPCDMTQSYLHPLVIG
jgi:hypothetical protein